MATSVHANYSTSNNLLSAENESDRAAAGSMHFPNVDFLHSAIIGADKSKCANDK